MARRRTSHKKQGRPSKKLNADAAVIILFVVGLLSGVLIYFKSGEMGKYLSDVLGGIFGLSQYIIPIGIIAIAIKMAHNTKDYIMSKLMQYGIVVGCISAVLSIYETAVTKSLSMNQDFENVLERGYYLGGINKGGGILGALVAYPLVKLLGVPGTVVLTIGMALVFSVFIFGIRPTEIISNIIEKIKENKEYDEEEASGKKEHVETRKERKQREREEKLRLEEEKRKEAEEVGQLRIKFAQDFKKGHKDSENPDANLFKQEDEKKENKTREVLQLEHAQAVEDEAYEYPPINLLSKNTKKVSKSSAKVLTDTASKLQKTLYSFGVSAKVEDVKVGPAITRYELKPSEGVRVSKIANLADDIALNLAAETIRIEAPIPGKQAVGIEVPNKEKENVHLRDVIETEEFTNNKSKLSVALGKDVAGQVVVADIAKMPHVLIAGSTGSGKSVCINTIITSIIYNAKPSEVKMVMIDPKIVELSVYNGIPHLLIPVVTDPKKAAGALAWAVQEMEDRYSKFASKGVRDLKGYNAAMEKEGEGKKLYQIVVIIDELADLMMVAAKDVEDAICRLAQKARAAGMHLVIATQRPSVDVITGLIKANVPSRIAFAVSSQVDSRTILDMAGAEKLLGKGDMLFAPAGAPKPTRIQGAFVSDDEVEKVVGFITANGTAKYSDEILQSIENSDKSDKELDAESNDDDTDPLLWDAMDTVVETGQASTSFIQRKFKVGYARAGRIIDQLEERGIISGYQGSKPRQVLMSKERLEELKMSIQNTNE